MVYFKTNDTLYPASIFGKETDRDWDNRPSKFITLEMGYEDAKNLFVDGLVWSQIRQDPSYVDEEGNTIIPDPVETDQSEFEVVGDITVHKNGTVTVKMGKPTAAELLETLEEALSV